MMETDNIRVTLKSNYMFVLCFSIFFIISYTLTSNSILVGVMSDVWPSNYICIYIDQIVQSDYSSLCVLGFKWWVRRWLVGWYYRPGDRFPKGRKS